MSHRALVLRVFPPIMLPVFLAVIDTTIVATALPAIAAQFGDVGHISWIVTAYLVANTIAAPVYGRLADLFGRRRLMLVSIVLFMATSLLCAAAPTLPLLVAARVLQGLGGGGLMTLSQALIGESVPIQQRGNFQGYLATVIVLSSSSGPVAGGFLTQAFGWPSVFLINLPLGLLALVLVLRLPAPKRTGGPVSFDGLGLLLLTAFVAPLLIALDRLSGLDAARFAPILAMIAAALVAGALLLRQERRARAPLIPPDLLFQPALWRAAAMASLAGAILVSLVTFMPIYLLVVGEAGPNETGWLLLPMTAAISTGSTITGRLISRTGRTAIFPSLGLMMTAAVLLTAALVVSRVDARHLPWIIAIGGFAQGSAMPVAQITAQAVGGRRQLGAAAGIIQLARSLGSAVGVAICGSVLFGLIAATDRATASLFAQIIDGGPAAMAALDPARAALVRTEVAGAFSAMLLTTAGFAATLSLLAWTMPIRRTGAG